MEEIGLRVREVRTVEQEARHLLDISNEAEPYFNELESRLNSLDASVPNSFSEEKFLTRTRYIFEAATIILPHTLRIGRVAISGKRFMKKVTAEQRDYVERLYPGAGRNPLIVAGVLAGELPPTESAGACGAREYKLGDDKVDGK